jgi:hypothetical protein
MGDGVEEVQVPATVEPAAPAETVAPADGSKTPPVKRRAPRIVRLLPALTGVMLALAIAAAYAGVQPFASLKDAVQQHLITLSEVSVPVPADQYPRDKRFTGTYKTMIPVLNYEQTLSFRGDTLTLVDQYAGTIVYRYTATMDSATEGTLELQQTGSGSLSTVPLQYIAESDCIILYSQGRDREGVAYCR